MLFGLKRIVHDGRSCTIVLQNENGPCPLIAIVNVLLLSARLNINADKGAVFLDELVTLLANHILETTEARIRGSVVGKDVAEAEMIAVAMRQQMNEVLTLLPTLATGLNLNVKFDDVDSFEYTSELNVFDILHIPLFHGWVMDGDGDISNSNDEEDLMVMVVDEDKEFVKKATYNSLLNKLVELQSPAATPKAQAATAAISHDLISFDDDDNNNNSNNNNYNNTNLTNSPTFDSNSSSMESKLRLKNKIEEFLNKSASQLTATGFFKLHQKLSPPIQQQQQQQQSSQPPQPPQQQRQQLAVFFRNNHFSTLCAVGGEVWLLATDQGFAKLPLIVWEKLDITGGGEFVDSNFRTPPPGAAMNNNNNNSNNNLSMFGGVGMDDGVAVSDVELARRLQLQEEERATLAEVYRMNQQQQQQQQHKPCSVS